MEELNETVRVHLAEKIAATGILNIGWARTLEHYVFTRYRYSAAYPRAVKRCLYHLRHNEDFPMEDLEALVIGDGDKEKDPPVESSEENEEEDHSEGLLQCFRCKSTRVESYQRQTRSADEAMTMFCMCLECHHKWKQ